MGIKYFKKDDGGKYIMKLPKVVIFDVGGTLITGELFESVNNGYKYLYDEVLDVKESYQDYMNFVSEVVQVIKEREKVSMEFSFHSLFNYLVLTYGLKTALDYECIERQFLSKFYTYKRIDYVKELLEYLREKNVKLAVFSNSMYSTAEIKYELKSVGILEYFDTISSSADHLVRKPSDKVFKLYIKKYGLMGYNSDEVCYIGNMFKYDIEPVLPLNMISIHKGDKFCYHADYLEVSSYLELIEEFKKDN